ncbi:MAG: ATP-binding protein [Bacteroidales bacterium]|jgi:Holliday junction resolvase-like predicted endonuclease|nr:ATP-binding protein [Bacteroidales bacterium]
MQKLPIGVQTFEKLRRGNYLYVDKTEQIYNLITLGGIYFLSRPRRFGKSLLISTMDALFTGKKELFDGLWIYDKWDWTQQYPVIHIDWTNIEHLSKEEIEISTLGLLQDIATMHSVVLTKKYASDAFSELIKSVSEKTGQKVVVLIDEYDAPILDTIGKSPENIAQIKEWLHNFYKRLKATDQYLKFLFLTGVSRFSGLSIFSGLNNPDDITIKEKYAAICGYTQAELERYFDEYIDDTAKHFDVSKSEILEDIRYWYNGYTWDGKTSIYNPFSTLLFFDRKEFAPYWFRTGTPTFLIDALKQKEYIDDILEPTMVGTDAFESYEPENTPLRSLLFQTGYLNIKQKEIVDKRPFYTLDVPNIEVRDALMKNILNILTKFSTLDMDPLRNDMLQHIRSGNADAFANDLRRLLANIPYELHTKNERFYNAIFVSNLQLLGFNIQSQISTNFGKIDAVLQYKDVAVVAELKFSAEKSAEAMLSAAMKQIKDRRYYEKYLNRKVLLLSLAFTGKDVACRIEELKV